MHAQRTAVAVVDDGTGEITTKTIYGRPHEVLPFLQRLESPVRAVYEAGPTGYGLVRRGRDSGVDVRVCAPGLIPTAGPGVRIKTDARDATKLARLLAAGQLTEVSVPTVAQENVRDLIRAWRTERRLYSRWQRLETERGKRPAIVAIAVARELSHFCWETATTP